MTRIAPGYRIAIVGSCQVSGLRRWTELMLPGVHVEAWHINVGPGSTPEVIAPRLPEFDLVIGQVADGSGGGVLEISRLRTLHGKVVYLPVLVFTGFHPDIFHCPLSEPWGGMLQGPLYALQSAIVVAAFRLGLPPERAVRLFNAAVFEHLGYFAAFEQARWALLKIFAESGYDLGGALGGWMRGGAFMYTENHPHLRVLRTLASLVLAKAGLDPAEVAESDAPPDDLAASLQWPVYPALARRIGVPGSLAFTRGSHDASDGESREMTLDAFVHETYRAMTALPENAFLPHAKLAFTTAKLRELLQAGAPA
jgi:hypothetical protein